MARVTANARAMALRGRAGSEQGRADLIGEEPGPESVSSRREEQGGVSSKAEEQGRVSVSPHSRRDEPARVSVR